VQSREGGVAHVYQPGLHQLIIQLHQLIKSTEEKSSPLQPNALPQLFLPMET